MKPIQKFCERCGRKLMVDPIRRRRLFAADGHETRVAYNAETGMRIEYVKMARKCPEASNFEDGHYFESFWQEI